MDKQIKYIRAGSLQGGEKYLCRTSPGSDNDRDYTNVIFVGYTACPPIVVVKDMKMIRFHCDRMDLFVLSKK